jgi:hypothetical protein
VLKCRRFLGWTVSTGVTLACSTVQGFKNRFGSLMGVRLHEELQLMHLTVTPWKESSGTCDCCGRTSRTVWGDISAADQTLAVYYVQWAVGSADHNPNFDLIIGTWGEGADPKRRCLVSLVYQPRHQGGFMVIDGESRPANTPSLCGRALKRAEVIGTALAKEAFQFVDAIWLHDSRIAEVRSLSHEAEPL